MSTPTDEQPSVREVDLDVASATVRRREGDDWVRLVLQGEDPVVVDASVDPAQATALSEMLKEAADG